MHGCGTDEILEILRSGRGTFGRVYTDTDSDGFNGKWKWCIQGNTINRIIFNDDDEAIKLMNMVVAEWREQVRKNEEWAATVEEMDKLIIETEMAALDANHDNDN